jgi:sugar lactone lactonase YvrE
MLQPMKGELIVDGLTFPEGPRWHGNRLWFTDQHAGEVLTVTAEGQVDRVLTGMEDRPGGLGFLPDGTALVVGMTQRRLHRLVNERLVLHADLSKWASFHCNDLLVDDQGRAYVGNFGYDVDAGEVQRPAELLLVETNGATRVVSRSLIFPNGMALSPDRKHLIVAETFAARISVFDVEKDGVLNNHRIWAELPGRRPDGLCLNAQGDVWYACPATGAVYLHGPDGQERELLRPRRPPYACMLGGWDRKTLFVCCASTHNPEEAARLRTGCIEAFDVAVAGAR